MKRVVDVARDIEIVAREVKGSCAAGIKPGAKMVVRGASLSLDESDCACVSALAALWPMAFAVRLGVDLEALGLGGRLWHCPDPGPPYTPGGAVLFEVRPIPGVVKE